MVVDQLTFGVPKHHRAGTCTSQDDLVAAGAVHLQRACPKDVVLLGVNATTVGEVIGEHETLSENPLLKVAEKKLVHKNKSGTKSYLLSHHDPQKQMDTYSIVFSEGSNADGIMIDHPGQEFIHVIKGSIKFLLDNEKYALNQGDSFYFNSSVSHNAKNIHDGISEIIWIITPPNI